MKEIIGTRIKQLRIKNGFSQEELAEKLNISRSALERMENGKSNSWATHLENLSDIFEVAPEKFVGGKNNVQKKQKQNSKKIIELLEARLLEKEQRLREKDEIIAFLKEKSEI